MVGRDQPDQRLYLSKDQEHLVWKLERAENELWKQPPDPVLEAVSKMVSAENPDWEGSPTELAETLQTDMAVNRLTKHLNVKRRTVAGRTSYKIREQNQACRTAYPSDLHGGRTASSGSNRVKRNGRDGRNDTVRTPQITVATVATVAEAQNSINKEGGPISVHPLQFLSGNHTKTIKKRS